MLLFTRKGGTLIWTGRTYVSRRRLISTRHGRMLNPQYRQGMDGRVYPSVEHCTTLMSMRNGSTLIWKGRTFVLTRKGLRLVSSRKGRRLVSTRKRRRLVSSRKRRRLVSMETTEACINGNDGGSYQWGTHGCAYRQYRRGRMQAQSHTYDKEGRHARMKEIYVSNLFYM
jgi:hypothetical protein